MRGVPYLIDRARTRARLLLTLRCAAAPINVEWGLDNRTCAIRSPSSVPSARRVENRLIGADANPYLAFATTLACGLLGLRERLQPSAEMKGFGFDAPHTLPATLGEALAALRREPALHAVLGEAFVRVYVEIKELELDAFAAEVTPWERQHLLLLV